MSSLRRSSRLAERAAREYAACTLYPRGTLKHFTKSIYGLQNLDEDSSVVLEELIDMLREDDRHTTRPDLMEATRRLYAALVCAETYNDTPVSDYMYKRLRRLVCTHTMEAYKLICASVRES